MNCRIGVKAFQSTEIRGFHGRLTSGGFLTIGYCFLEIFVGGQGFDGGDKVVMGDPPVPHARENPGNRHVSEFHHHQGIEISLVLLFWHINCKLTVV